MCGIVGLFAKDKRLEPQLGALLSDMLITMSDRGPDSAGVAVYGHGHDGRAKITLQNGDPDADLDALVAALRHATGETIAATRRGTHAVLELGAGAVNAARRILIDRFAEWRVMSTGGAIEIYKEVGLPARVVEAFDVPGMTGTHGIGHTRMATESAVTTHGAHPFSTGADECLVHNGSLSNHNNIRRDLARKGLTFETENDSEVAAAYLTDRMNDGADLGQALECALRDLDGFFTFVVGTRDGFGVLRDPIACKPAVMAETDRFVAFGSEYRALVDLPGIEGARVWEPEPATVYFWRH
ncbi:class II glutamine amidotransferase [Roseitalea porphyridii]|uniref:Glutamine amidotransferase n=1 Tax=Roseitalea porphyridii TaxID=1852022 RepID=A0A4P6UZF3_9HYPH|nr:glutamine amidotransferase family protein [Roseitalea porphyridii]QBK30175.1 glutamine amidotransferase [Roseitalea porphyridii]